jgi:uncharacterized protein YhjY with autotransporter beta-barrel domain
MSTNCTVPCGLRLAMRWLLALFLLAVSPLSLAAPACATPKSVTVTSGGSVTIDVSDCDGPDNFGMTDGGQPAHGNAVLSGQLDVAGTETVTYNNNGDGATSDSFYLLDQDSNQIVFNITINPSLSASIAVSPSSRNEDSGAAFTYTVTLSQTSSSATTVNLSRSGTATSGTDYTGAVNSVVVAANATTATFDVTPVADTTVEADETVVISVASGSGYGIGSPSSATATILNDDVPTATIAVSPASVSEDGANNLIYTVTLDQAALSAVSVAFSVGGSATSGTDYAAVSSPLVIAAGQTSGTITLNPTADGTVESDETVVISLAAGSGYSVGSPDSATGIILNDDQPSLTIDDVSLSEGDAGTSNATFTVALSQAAGTGGVSFDIATADGTATAGVDYVASSLTGQTIAAGSSSATFTVLVNGDTLNEPNETFFVNVSNVSGASVGDAQGQGTIVNDDAQPTLSIDDVSVNEGNSGTTTATFTVSLSAASGQTVSVNYASADGTASAGSDYVARSGTLTFSPGTTAQGVAITVNGDTAVESDETFSVGLSGASNAAIAGATGTGTILNDDAVVTVGPASLPAATAGSAYSQTLSASGGTAPYTFGVSAGTLPAGLSLDAAGVLSGTPTGSGSFNFTATATDSGGSPTSGNRVYTLTVASPTLTLPATTLAGGTAGQAYTAAINQATGGIAPYTYTLSAGALPAGVTVNSATGTLSGTPTVAGTYAFTLSATDSTTGTAGQASQSYSLSIVSPTLSIAPSTLPAGAVGTAYSQTLSASGGTAPYSYALSAGALPGGLMLTAGGMLSGTPSVAGSFAFTVTATDSTAGVAAQASYAYTLNIASPTLAIAPATLAAGTVGTAYSQSLSASGGTAPYSYSVSAGTLPTGLTLTAAGVLAGTPTAAGSSAFTISVTDAGSVSAAQAYTLAIASAVSAPVAVNDTGATLVDTAVTLAVTGNDTGSIDTIAVSTAPTHGTAAVDGVQLVYTPATGYVGADSVSYTATGPGGTSAAATVTITVNARPVAVSATRSAVSGEAHEVDLTSNATGGPLVAAALVAISPANAGTATIARSGGASVASTGTPTAAATEGPSFIMTFTPTAAFSGQATVRFTLSNAHATSDEASIVFVVAPRPDPSLDAEVRGLIDAQAESTRRFAKAQIDNFQRRLEATHRGDRGFDNHLSFQATTHCRQAERGMAAQPCSQPTWDADTDTGDTAPPPSTASRTAVNGELGLWVGGAIRSGSLNKQSQRAGVDFQSDGLSMGADYRVSNALALGAGVGWGRDDSDVGNNGSRSKATASTLALYVSFHPGRYFFFDTLLGYQLLSYDLRRHVVENDELAEGRRDGSQWIASLSTGADLQHGHWQITPYARVDMARATLDAYSEAAMVPYALHYADMDVSTTTGNLGLRLEWRRKMRWGQFTPQLRVEYQRDFQGRGDATLSFADLTDGGPLYRTGLSVFDRNRLMLGLGVVFTTEQGLSTRVEYRGVTDGDSGSDQTWMFNIEKKY